MKSFPELLPGRWLGWGLALILLLVTFGLGYAFAQAIAVPHYTGCLRTKGSGQFYNFTEGNSPLAPCNPGDANVTLSGGDISAVNAGLGLNGGGDNGDIALSIAPAYQLPQGCVDGQVPAWNGTKWICSTASSGGGGEVLRNFVVVATAANGWTSNDDNQPCTPHALIGDVLELWELPHMTTCGMYFVMPMDYASGDVNVIFHWHQYDRGGTVVLQRYIYKTDLASGSMVSLGETDMNLTNDASSSGIYEFNIPEQFITPGDYYYITLRRTIPTPGDTAGQFSIDGGIGGQYLANP